MNLQKLYSEERRKGYRPPEALRAARTTLRWQAAESAGLVRIRYVTDDNCNSYDDVEGDYGQASDWPGGQRALVAARKECRRIIDRDGVWGCIGEYRLQPCPLCWADGYQGCVNCQNECHNGDHSGWESGDSIWSLVGPDAHCYLPDIREQTLKALADALRSRCPTCHQPRK